MRIVCQQTILMKYHTLFVIFEKNCRLLQIVGGALWFNMCSWWFSKISENAEKEGGGVKVKSPSITNIQVFGVFQIG